MAEQKQNLPLTECGNWSDGQNCGQDCLEQIDNAPEECQVRSMLVDWHKDRRCSVCSVGFGGSKAHNGEMALGYSDRPALISPDGKMVEWVSLSVEKLSDALETHEPVCWRCLVADTIRRQQPELVAGG